MGPTLGAGGGASRALLMLRLGRPVQRTVMSNAAKRLEQRPPESRDIGRGRSVFWPEKSAKNGPKRGSKKGSKSGQKTDQKGIKRRGRPVTRAQSALVFFKKFI